MAESAPSASKKWPKIFPDADLLTQVEGVEQGLRQRRRLGSVGWVGLVVSGGLQVSVAVLNSKWLDALKTADWSTLLKQWWLLLPIVAAVLFFLLYGWSRFWLKESQEPFRYTCSIADFAAVKGTHEEDKLRWLTYDLGQKLNQRVGRLRFLEDQHLKADAAETGSHIHVRGAYVRREDRDGRPVLDVSTSVRIGGPNKPETMGHPVVFALGDPATGDATPTAPAGETSLITVAQYEQLVERVYFSAATEIYRQIRDDVANKIALLPTSHFRAMAFFYEAEDYARSNTLDAYDEARQLYEKAALLLDPSLATLPEGRIRRWLRSQLRLRFGLYRWARQLTAEVLPRVGEREILCARAEVGYAAMLLYRRVLAAISGQRTNPIFEAPRVLDRAIGRVTPFSTDVPGRDRVLFDAYVLRALAMTDLGSPHRGERALKEAQRLDPARAEQDARYFFVGGAVAGDPRARAASLRRAIELQPRFEVAHFSLARAAEDLWRSRPAFERKVAVEVVLKEYGEILTTNPGSIGAWANRGYIRWLLVTDTDRDKDLEAAAREFRNGRDYKAIKRETFVAELDYGLARIAAERGRFDEAYIHYAHVVSTQFVLGVNYTDYYFQAIGPVMLERFERYQRSVEGAWREQRDADASGARHRVLDSVYAFVLNDFGEACLRYAGRTGDAEARGRAGEAFKEAARLDPANPTPHFMLADLEPYDGDRHLKHVLDLEPDWAVAMLKRTESLIGKAADLIKCAERKEGEADKAAGKKDTAAAAQPARVAASSDAPRSASTGAPVAREIGAEDLASDGIREERLRQQAEQLRKDAAAFRRQAAQADIDARKLVRRLLPHEWLWRGGGDPPLFNWHALDRPDYVDELKWERELSEWNALALCTWAEALVQAPAWGEAAAGVDSEQPARLLARARKHFWPDRVESILARRAAAPHEQLVDEDIQALRAVINDWCARDPTNLPSLSWLTDPVIEVEERRAHVLALVERPELSPAVCRWLGDRLRELDEQDKARMVYLRGAAATHDPGLALGIGEGLEHVDCREDAFHLYEQALAWTTSSITSLLRVRHASCAWALRRRREALMALGTAQGTNDLGAGWRTDFIGLVLPSTRDDEGRRQLRQWLEDEHRRARGAGDESAGADARRALLEIIEARVGTDGQHGKELPVATPIVLEADGALFPTDEKVMETHELMKDLLPAMRERIHGDTGVKVPGVRVRANDADLGSGAYVVQINDIPQATSAIDPSRIFCPSPAGLTGPDGAPGSSPFTGEANGAWVAAGRTEELRAAGVVVWTHWEYMTRHMERVVRAALPSFLGLQELDNMLVDWRFASDGPLPEPARRELMVAALPDARARIRFLQMLHALLRESISITNLGALLGAFQAGAPRHRDLTELVEAVRATVKPPPAAGAADAALVPLVPAFEDVIARAVGDGGGDRVLALPRNTEQQLLAAVRRRLAPGDARRVVIVTQRPSVRPYVRRLLEVDFPGVQVIHLRELHWSARRELTAAVEYP